MLSHNFLSFILSIVYRLVLLVPCPESNGPPNRRGSPSHEALLPRRKSPALCANQRASSWRGLSDVICHSTGYHDNTSAHDIRTSNIIIRRKSIIPSDIPIQNPYLLHMYIYLHNHESIRITPPPPITFTTKYKLIRHSLKHTGDTYKCNNRYKMFHARVSLK